MDPQILRAGFRIGVLIFALSIAMLPFQPRDSAEFVVTVLAALVGGVFVLSVALAARSANPRLPGAKGPRKDYNNRSKERGH